MRLSEIPTTDNLKILICGPAGTGKTVFAAGAPPPILYLDFDNKIGSAQTFYKGQERLSQIEVKNLSRQLDDSDPIEELNRIIRTELIPQKKAGKLEFRTIVLDSLTTFSGAVLRHIIRTNPGISRPKNSQGTGTSQQDYGILKTEFERFIPGLLSLPCNIIMCAHIKTDKDELTGEIIRAPFMDGSFYERLPAYFSEVWRTYVEGGKYFAQTKSDHRFSCTSRMGLSSPIELKFDNVVKQ